MNETETRLSDAELNDLDWSLLPGPKAAVEIRDLRAKVEELERHLDAERTISADLAESAAENRQLREAQTTLANDLNRAMRVASDAVKAQEAALTQINHAISHYSAGDDRRHVDSGMVVFLLKRLSAALGEKP